MTETPEPDHYTGQLPEDFDGLAIRVSMDIEGAYFAELSLGQGRAFRLTKETSRNLASRIVDLDEHYRTYLTSDLGLEHDDAMKVVGRLIDYR